MPATQLIVRLPYDGSVVESLPLTSPSELDQAITRAEVGAKSMAALSNGERSGLLLKAQSLLRRDAEEFARIISLETGKPIKEARRECERGLDTLFESALAARELAGEVIPMDAAAAGKGRMGITVREPVGVIGAITPWNLPLNLALHKVGPALAAGNAVVHKPSEITPLSALRLGRLLEEAGVPAGAYNVVVGAEDIGQMLVRDPRVAMISFTGSAEAGKWIRANAGLKKVTLELGGNSAVIIERDADVGLAVARAVEGGYTNNGQTCISVQRIFVHQDVADEFQSKLLDAVRRLVIGHPLEDSSDLTSLISEDEAARVESWIQEAVDQGAELLTPVTRRKAVLTPAVVAKLPSSSKMACSEVFGPVVALDVYSDTNAAVEQVNATPYGLQAGLFTQSISRAFSIARQLRVGGVMINDVPTFRADHMPYGGVKESGLGREGPRYAVEEMTDLKLICWR